MWLFRTPQVLKPNYHSICHKWTWEWHFFQYKFWSTWWQRCHYSFGLGSQNVCFWCFLGIFTKYYMCPCLRFAALVNVVQWNEHQSKRSYCGGWHSHFTWMSVMFFQIRLYYYSFFLRYKINDTKIIRVNVTAFDCNFFPPYWSSIHVLQCLLPTLLNWLCVSLLFFFPSWPCRQDGLVQWGLLA